jgi:sarcosine oxidase subunit beta
MEVVVTEHANVADVVVIGGGCVGVSIAYHLAKQGIGKVVLLEKEFLAAGSTGRSAAIIRQHYGHPTTAKMALESLKVFQDFEELVGGHADFVQTGFAVAVGPSDVKALEASVAIQQSVGVRTEILPPDDLRQLEPAINLDGLAAAAYEPDSGYVDPHAVVSSYADAARKSGAEIYQKVPAISIGLNGGRITGVSTPEGVISTPLVVNAAGPWANQIGRMIGLEWPLHLSTHDVAVLGRPIEFDYQPAVVCDMVNRVWFRPETGHCLVVGSTDDEDTTPLPDPENPDNFPERPDFEFVIEMVERLCGRYPIMETGDARYRQSWSGPSARTPDMGLILGPIPEIEGFYCAIGLSGHGFKLSPMIGCLMAELIVTGQVSSLDISIFAPDRFRDMVPDAIGKLPSSLLG